MVGYANSELRGAAWWEVPNQESTVYKMKARGVDEMTQKECIPLEEGQGENLGIINKIKFFSG